MLSTTLPRHPVFDLYAEGLNATEKAMTFWGEMFRSSSDLAWWWAERWMQAPKAFSVWSPLKASEPPAATEVIDQATTVAERAATKVAETIEAVAEVQIAAVEEAAAIVETVADAVIEEVTLEPDDLTQLVGIGPKLSVALAERGVSRFSQIAAWTEQDLLDVDKALDLKGRAVRDAWIAQAKRFAEA